MTGSSVIVKVPKTKNFTQVENDTVRDGRLSFRATGLLVYLLGLPPRSSIDSKLLARRKREGRDAIQAAFRELEDAGYVHRRVVRDAATGKVASIAYVLEVADQDFLPDDIRDHLAWLQNLQSGPEPDSPAPENPAPVEEGSQDRHRVFRRPDLPAPGEPAPGEPAPDFQAPPIGKNLGKTADKIAIDDDHSRAVDGIESSSSSGSDRRQRVWKLYGQTVAEARVPAPDDFAGYATNAARRGRQERAVLLEEYLEVRPDASDEDLVDWLRGNLDPAMVAGAA